MPLHPLHPLPTSPPLTLRGCALVATSITTTNAITATINSPENTRARTELGAGGVVVGWLVGCCFSISAVVVFVGNEGVVCCWGWKVGGGGWGGRFIFGFFLRVCGKGREYQAV